MSSEREIQFGALKIFAAVAESDTLTKAAQKLGITQSAVSQAIAQLEDIMATELVVRRSRPIKLTPAGKVLKDHTGQILAATRNLFKEVATAAAGDLPRLKIGIIDSFADAAGQQLMGRIASIAPQLSIQTGLTAPLSQALLSRDLDLLITSDPMHENPELERHPILRDPFVMLVARNKCDSADVTPETLAREFPFVRYTRQSRLGMLTDVVTRRLGIEPETRYEFDSTQTLLRTVQAGHGWAIATSLCVIEHPLLLEGVQILPLASSANARYVSLVARHNELADTPRKIAAICRDIFTNDVLPRTLSMMPWLEDQAVAIDEAPIV